MFSAENSLYSKDLLSTSKVDSFCVNDIVKKKAKALQCKYNLSDEQINEIVSSLYCIAENVIRANIKKRVTKLPKQ